MLHYDWSALLMLLHSDWLISLQVHKTVWHEVLEGGSFAVDQPCDGGVVKSWPGFLDGAEVCSAPHNSPQVSNKL